MHAFVKQRIRNASVSAVAPKEGSEDHSTALAALATKILYRSPLKSPSDLPIFILNSAALPNAKETSFDALLPYVLSRLPNEDELIGGKGYEIVFFAGGDEGGGGASSSRAEKEKPSVAWMFKAYHVLSRATRKRLQRLYIVHERRWVRVCVEAFAHVVSPKFRRKVVHGRSWLISYELSWASFASLMLSVWTVSTLEALASYLPLEDLLIPPSAYLYARAKPRKRHSSGIKRAFGVANPLPISSDGSYRLPRVLRESTSFVLLDQNIRTEGLFRVNARAATVDILAEAYDRGQKFVIWKEKDSVLTYSHFQEGLGDVIPEEIEHTEGFGVQAAAGLIKRWYAELKEPIFPTSSYLYMKQAYSKGAATITESSLCEDLILDTDHPHIPKTSQMILTAHLLPLLAKVSENQDFNHMSPKSLALCIAPNLTRGSDQLQEVEMSGITSSFLEAAIINWKAVSSRLGLDEIHFQDSLRAPEAIQDREDPPEQGQATPGVPDQLGVEDELDGITMVDNDEEAEDARELEPPFLPPRPDNAPDPQEHLSKPSSAVSRKPAPFTSRNPIASVPISLNETGSAGPGSPIEGFDASDAKRQTTTSSVSRKPVTKTTASLD